MPECYAPIPAYPGFLIRMGARGDYVRQIQACLNSVNNAGLATDGIFGPLTDAAVRNFQRANGLAVDGIVGPITWENLFRRCRSSTPVARASGSVIPDAVVVSAATATPIATVTPAARVMPMANAETPSEIMSDVESDHSSFDIEYAPNFAAKDQSDTEYIEETLGKVEPARGAESMIIDTPACSDLESCGISTTNVLKKFSTKEILTYLLNCHTD